jgi:hypothetical protein
LLLKIVVSDEALSIIKCRIFLPKFSLPFISSVLFAFIANLFVLPEKSLDLVFVIALFAALVACFLTFGS